MKKKIPGFSKQEQELVRVLTKRDRKTTEPPPERNYTREEVELQTQRADRLETALDGMTRNYETSRAQCTRLELFRTNFFQLRDEIKAAMKATKIRRKCH